MDDPLLLGDARFSFREVEAPVVDDTINIGA